MWSLEQYVYIGAHNDICIKRKSKEGTQGDKIGRIFASARLFSLGSFVAMQ
jgi:hypothetical protein